MNDPLDAVSVTGDEAAELKRDDLARKLRTYLERMPAEWRRLFLEQFQRISSAELAQLRADLKAAQERIAELTQDDRYCPLCTWRGPVELVNGVCPQCDVDWPKACREHRDALTVAQERIAEMARQLDAARNCITRRLRYHRNYPLVNSARWTDRENGISGEDARDCDCDYCIEDRAWLAANPAPQEAQP